MPFAPIRVPVISFVVVGPMIRILFLEILSPLPLSVLAVT